MPSSTTFLVDLDGVSREQALTARERLLANLKRRNIPRLPGMAGIRAQMGDGGACQRPVGCAAAQAMPDSIVEEE
jgi:hypothetical protein